MPNLGEIKCFHLTCREKATAFDKNILLPGGSPIWVYGSGLIKVEDPGEEIPADLEPLPVVRTWLRRGGTENYGEYVLSSEESRLYFRGGRLYTVGPAYPCFCIADADRVAPRLCSNCRCQAVVPKDILYSNTGQSGRLGYFSVDATPWETSAASDLSILQLRAVRASVKIGMKAGRQMHLRIKSIASETKLDRTVVSRALSAVFPLPVRPRAVDIRGLSGLRLPPTTPTVLDRLVTIRSDVRGRIVSVSVEAVGPKLIVRAVVIVGLPMPLLSLWWGLWLGIRQLP